MVAIYTNLVPLQMITVMRNTSINATIEPIDIPITAGNKYKQNN